MAHMIRTIEELIDIATKENLPTLIEDLELFLDLHIHLRATEQDADLVLQKVFHWNDDGEPGIAELRVELEDGAKYVLRREESILDEG